MVIVPVSSVLSSQSFRHGLAPLQSKVCVLRRLSSLVSVAHHQMLSTPLLLVASSVMVNVSPWLTLLSDSRRVRLGPPALGVSVAVAAGAGAGGAGPGPGGCSTATAGQFVASKGYSGP